MSEPPSNLPSPRPVPAAEEHAAGAGVRSALRVPRRGAAPALASPHSHKFRLAAAVLAIIGVGAITIAVIAASAGRVTGHTWSAWQPQFGGVAGAREIAGYVAPGYRISPTQQLAVVSVSANLNGSTLILQEGPTNASGVLSGDTVVYQFCGLGPACSIPGKPSRARLLLTRLEAFELALYTLRYLGNVQNVVSILPPAVQQVPPQTTGSTSVLSPTPPSSLGKSIVAVEFNRNELQPILNDPLTDFFPNKPLALGGVISSQAIATMDFITANQLFTPSTTTGQDGTQYLVLSQLPAQ